MGEQIPMFAPKPKRKRLVEPITNPPPGERERDEAVKRAEEHADPEWATAAEAEIRRLAATREPFTTDDAVVDEVGTHEPRAWGAIVTRLKASGEIRPTGNWVLSRNATCHRRPKREWVGVK